MTLIEYPDVEQGSDTWHDLRRGMLTASVVGRLITPSLKVADNDTSRGTIALLVAERITGHTEPTFTTDDMFRGVLSEPLARDKYSEHYAPVREYGYLVRQFDGFELGFSPDGTVGDEGLIEVKAPRPKTHLRTILEDRVPPQYMPQVQCGLLVSGRQWCDFLSYSGGLPMWTKRVEADPAWFDAILAAAEAFERTAVEMVARYRQAIVGLPTTERIDTDLELVI